ncbi:MAG: hypothetical protein WD341_12445 [Tistlia sp.]|uniref:hypothetical protein n=1 Tax=Tistlia sp. TaxID=3057121 RepID=UPI0034A1FC3B
MCRFNPHHFVRRLREVGGFDLHKAPQILPLGVPDLPLVVPLIDHRYRRVEILTEPTVALPLYKVVNLRTGELHVRSRRELQDRFRIREDAQVLLSGVGRDPVIERWWELPDQSKLLAELRRLGVSLITSPNYSVLNDVPRTDNLYAMKKILLAWCEMMSAGVRTALHINARTERDYERWAELIRVRPEIETIAFEFGTGCGRGDRIEWHVAQLTHLAQFVGRPLGLIVRGGGRKLLELRSAFEVTLLDTDGFSRTYRRRKAYFAPDGRLKWARFLTRPDEPLDELIAHNISCVRAYYVAMATLLQPAAVSAVSTDPLKHIAR